MDTFLRDPAANAADQQLVTQALGGDRRALETLLRRHKDFVYNLALKLFLDPADAQDAAQEVLIKAVTHLSRFRGESAFRTWLYTIVVNQFRSTRRRRLEAEYLPLSEALAGFAVEPAADEPEPAAAQVEDVRILCSTGMLLCLDREQRLLLVVGDVFGVGHQLGAELFGLSPGNYRTRLSRARQDLRAFVAGRCGLVNPANPCRCPAKTRALIRQGAVDPGRQQFYEPHARHVAEVVAADVPAVADSLYHAVRELFLTHPFRVFPQVEELLESLVRQGG